MIPFPLFFTHTHTHSLSPDLSLSLSLSPALTHTQADVVLVVTCAIRENAESKVWSRLDYYRSIKQKRKKSISPLKIGVLGKRVSDTIALH